MMMLCSGVLSLLLMYVSLFLDRLTHICVGNLTIIGSDNGLSPGRRQAIIWTNSGILLIWSLETNFSEILIGFLTFSFKKMRLKVSSVKWRPFCLGFIMLKRHEFHRKGTLGDTGHCEGALMISLLLAWVCCLTVNPITSDLGHHDTHLSIYRNTSFTYRPQDVDTDSLGNSGNWPNQSWFHSSN